MRIEIDTKFSVGDIVYVVGNTNISFNEFLEGKEYDCVHEKTIKRVSGINFTKEKIQIFYCLDEDWYKRTEEEELFITRKEAEQWMGDAIIKRLQSRIEQTKSAISNSKENLPLEMSKLLRNISDGIDNLKQLEKKLEEISCVALRETKQNNIL